MKKIFFPTIIMFAAMISLSTSLQAQKSNPRPFIVDSNVTGELNKPPTENINNKALKSFNNRYKTTANVAWSATDEVIYAYFKENGKQTRVFYNLKGKWQRTIISYDPTLLQHHVKSIVKSNFSGFQIKWVTELHEGSMNAYIVTIENATEFKEIIVYEDQAFVYKEYKKA
jgi:hypothetical protein